MSALLHTLRLARKAASGAVLSGAAILAATGSAQAATPSVEVALKLTPVQKDVEIDVPAAEQVASCTIKAEKLGEETAWIVRDAQGQILRRFSDTNNDNVVDLWCYYHRGIEVYRDVDSNHNNKADQCRWLHTAGTRWGLDRNEDGAIDLWKQISAEEVTAEVVAALAAGDAARFARLLPTKEELNEAGIGPEKLKEISNGLGTAAQAFATLTGDKTAVSPQMRWLQFGSSRPGIVPRGTDGSTKDIVVYENTLAITDTAGKTGQIQIGSLIRIGDTWRLIDGPRLADTDQLAMNGRFFNMAQQAAIPDPAAQGAGSEKMQKLLTELDQLDKSAEKNPAEAESPEYNSRRAELLEAVLAESSGDDRIQWIRQFADTVSAATQSGLLPDGVARLEKLAASLGGDASQQELAAYVAFRTLTASYGLALQDPNANYEKTQTAWLDGLKKFVTDYPQAADTAEALLQLGIAEEFAGNETEAIAWYDRIVQGFPQATSARKAAGAKIRLSSVGKSITLKGPALNGPAVDVQKLRGKIVLIHYWASNSEPSKTDLAQLKELFGKYGKAGFAPIGVCLDSNRDELVAYLQEYPLMWPQIYEPGGLESRLATEMGILTLPTMILIDEKGQVVNRAIHVSEIESELKKRFGGSQTTRRPAATQPR